MIKSNEQKNILLVSTSEAARLLCLRPQTLRKWVMDGRGPIQPIKIGNRLRWKLKDIKELCNAEGDE
ncbi:helix-turn-helix domain-containing protein [Acinetobacter sp.]|uniref:helix-turn-helix domain-containing protein n=1 Tax=Acinetobacter sp. TaxID=472 RepID=UPI0028AED7DA|nr:helix-turn-helix domain-containing protein [Acinetobacter sp.]